MVGNSYMNNFNDQTMPTNSSGLVSPKFKRHVGIYPPKQIPLPKNKFKKNDLVNFKFKKKLMSGKVIKTGDYGVDVVCNGKYYYCYDLSSSDVFNKSNATKNYSISMKKR
jgi:hypothetical protein